MANLEMSGVAGGKNDSVAKKRPLLQLEKGRSSYTLISFRRGIIMLRANA